MMTVAADTRYCMYDYVFTSAWVEKLIREPQTGDGYRAVFGKEPVPKPAAATGGDAGTRPEGLSMSG
jgi:hypothetical protein